MNSHRYQGRVRQFRSLISRLQSGFTGTPGSALVVGGPGFGKSSFVMQLARRENREGLLGPLAKQLSFCPLRVPRAESLDERSFLGMMRQALDGTVVEEVDQSCTEAELERALQDRIQGTGRAQVFLVDDFHIISQSPEFSVPFFSFLRYLGYSLRAGYVLTSQLDISQMAVRQEVQASPFWNIFSKIRLGPLQADDARKALLGTLDGVKGVRDEHAQVLAPITGGLPFLVGALAEALKDATQKECEAWGARRIFEDTLKRAAPVLDEIWGDISPSGKEALRELLEGNGALSPGARDALLPSAESGYLDRKSFEPRSLVLRWDWTRRVGGDPEPLARGLPELPPPREGILKRLFTS